MNKTLGVVVGEPPRILQKDRLDNIALVPASLLPLKGTYQPLANRLPTGSVLCVPGTQKQRTIMATVTRFFKDHGHTVITMPIEDITRQLPRPARPQPENLHLAF
jgi:hypothetical protein